MDRRWRLGRRDDAGKSSPGAERALTVCLIAPLPPPFGGIAHWAQMMLTYAGDRADVRMVPVDTAPRWRATYDLRLWKRMVGGSVQLCRDLATVFWVLVRHRPDVAHLTTSGHLAIVRDVAVICAAALLRIKVVYHLHFGRVPAIAANNTLEWVGLRFAMRRAATVVALDAGTRDAIRRNAPQVMVQSVPNCVASAEFADLPCGSGGMLRSIVYVGWVIRTKGLDELLDAWARLQPTGWRLSLIGPGDLTYRAELLERYKPGQVEFVGELRHPDAMKAVAAAEVVVLPSHTEGFPYSVLEAMFLGKAIIATSVGAIPEMLAGECGVLVPPRNACDLARAIERVIGDPGLRKAMGERARARAESEYSIHAVFAQHMSLWRNVSGAGR